MKKIISIATIAAISLGFAGCTTKNGLGHFTAASTHNVRNLNYDIDNKTKVLTSGESCISSIFGFRLGEVENRQEIAMNDAIRKGHNNNVDGDLLVNVQITEKITVLPFYWSNCIEVEGDLIKLK